jgi:hypothetical protein
MSQKARKHGDSISETAGTNLEEVEAVLENQKPPEKAKAARGNI